MSKTELIFTVNGDVETLHVDAHRPLLDVLREDLRLTGAKRACDTGECGCCTVLIDGFSARSCLYLAARANGRSVTTIEGLATDGLHPVQAAFVELGALQCGFCTPGMIMMVASYLTDDPHPTEEGIRRALSSNLCRCTGYKAMEAAVSLAARRMREKGRPADGR